MKRPAHILQPFLRVTEPARSAFAIYWPAILCIQFFGLLVVLAYYQIDGAETVFRRIALWKKEGGYLFAGISTIISAGVIPELLKRKFRPPANEAPSRGELAHQFTMWAAIGVLVDAFYRLQGHWFGDGTEATTILTKVLVDQLGFTPLVALPFMVTWSLFREVAYRPRELARRLSFSLLRERVLPLWATCLVFWPVMLLVIYDLPSLLQFPLFLFGNSAFSILMIFILRRQAAAETTRKL